MTCKILIEKTLFETRIATLQDDTLTDLILTTDATPSKVGAIYLGRVARFSDSMDAAFIDLGHGTDGVLFGSHTSPGKAAKKSSPITEKLTEGEKCLVQIIKDAKGDKGLQLSTFIELSEQFVILKPQASGITFSRKIKDEEFRSKVTQLITPLDGGYVIRSSALNHPTRILQEQALHLHRIWAGIATAIDKDSKPRRLLAATPEALMAAQTATGPDVKILTNDAQTYQQIKTALAAQSNTTIGLALQTAGTEPLFDQFQIEDQVSAASDMRLPLPRGGNITIEETEALCVIDVNSGATGKLAGLKSAARQINEEAARLALAQIRLRNISGIIIIDFIQMAGKDQNRALEELLKNLAKSDPCPVRIIGMTELGLMQLTRQRKSPPLSAAMTTPVSCGTDSVPQQYVATFIRDVQRFAATSKCTRLAIQTSRRLAPLLRTHQTHIESSLNLTINWTVSPALYGYNYRLDDDR